MMVLSGHRFMIRRKGRLFSALMSFFVLVIPVIAEAQTTDLKEADTCRKNLLVVRKGRSDQGRLKICIALYERTRSFREGRGRAAYEVARLYHLSGVASDPFNVDDLRNAEKYYEEAIRQGQIKAGLMADAKKLLRSVKFNLKEVLRTTVRSETDKVSDKTNPIDSDATPRLDFILTPRLSFGAKINVGFRRRKNRDLLNSKQDGDKRTSTGFSMAVLYHLRPKIEFFLAGEIEYESRVKDGKEDEATQVTEVSLSRAHLLWNSFLFPSIRLQVGRQKFKDLREWVYDETLDGIRIYFGHERFELQFSVSTNLIDPEDPEDEIRNVIAYVVIPLLKKDKAELYWISRKNSVGEHLDLRFVGASWKGKSLKRKRYWLEIGSVSGEEGPVSVSGYGFDLGGSARFKFQWRPSLTLGYAFGSGDKNPDDGIDQSFRQTGLQDNSAKFWGVTRIKYYGELFDPELSNMMIGTLGVGMRPMKKASIDLVYHHYTQVWALRGRDNELRDVGIKEDPTGESRDLGDEIDLILGMKVAKRIKIEMISAFFFPGTAFVNSDTAYLFEVKGQFNF